MSMVLAFQYEDTIEPGSAVVVGSGEGLVALPGSDGAGVFAGVFSAQGNVKKERPDSPDTLGVTVHGLCKVRAEGPVTAFAFGKIADETGAMEVIGAAPAGPLHVTGFFLEPGADGELVDFFVQPFLIPAASGT